MDDKCVCALRADTYLIRCEKAGFKKENRRDGPKLLFHPFSLFPFPLFSPPPRPAPSHPLPIPHLLHPGAIRIYLGIHRVRRVRVRFREMERTKEKPEEKAKRIN